MRYRINCTIPHPNHERIDAIGCVDQTLNSHRFTEAEAIAKIKSRLDSFFVERPDGHKVEVMVETSPSGREFLKTEADGEKPNNLLSLPHCKAHVSPAPPPRGFVPARSHGVATV